VKIYLINHPKRYRRLSCLWKLACVG